MQGLVDLHAVPLVELADQKIVQLLQVLRLQVQVLAQHKHLREMFEDVLNEEFAGLDICPVELEGIADFVVHRLEEFHQFLPLVRAVHPVFLNDLWVHFEDVGFVGVDAEVELLDWLLRDTSV